MTHPAAPARPPIDWDARVARADALLTPCRLCEHRCGVDRRAGERGRCGLADTTHVYSMMLHFGEEHHLVPSFIVSLSGCSMHCTFCSEDRHLRPPFPAPAVSPEALARHLARALPPMRPAPRNINFVGGEPSISLPFILRVARHLASAWPAHPPLLLNTNGYITPEALALTEGVFGIHVVDLKFGDDACAWRVGKIARYWQTLTACLQTLAAAQPRPQLVVRHLLMPGHLDCCTRPALAWFAAHLADVATLNLMPGFVPFAHTRAEQRWATLAADEVDAALTALRALDLPAALWDGAPLPRPLTALGAR